MDPKIRRAATAEVARSKEPDPTILLAAARDPDADVSMLATSRLGKLYADGEVSTADMLARVRDKNQNPRVRVVAMNGLGMVPTPDAAKLLVELLATGDLTERRAAAVLLQHQDPALAIPALIDALGDADEYVRAAALDSLRVRSRGRDFGTDAAAWRAWWQSRR